MKYIKPVSYAFIGSALLFLFLFHLMTALIGGITVFVIVKNIYKWLGTKVHTDFAHKLTILSIIVLTISLLSLVGIGVYSGVHFGQSSFVNLSDDALNVLQQLKTYLPESLVAYIPEDVVQLKEHITEVLKHNLPNMLTATTTSLKGFFHIIIGMLIGGVASFSFLKRPEEKQYGILTGEIMNRLKVFAEVFQKVIFAQVKISTINTVLTGIYLLIVLPIFDTHVPYAKTLVLLTFMFGLLPVVGNLLSNTLIALLSLMVSAHVAIASLTFLIIVHKLEYYVNAKIVGSQIKTSIWEMLIVMLAMESVFGIVGVVLGPVIYGYIKEELKLNELI